MFEGMRINENEVEEVYLRKVLVGDVNVLRLG